MEDRDKVLDWLFNSRETGLSSKSLAAAFLGVDEKHPSYPMDPSDLRRCLLLIDRVPPARDAVKMLAEKYPTWKRLSDKWGEIVALFDDECGLNLEHGTNGHKTYAAMKRAIYGK